MFVLFAACLFFFFCALLACKHDNTIPCQTAVRYPNKLLCYSAVAVWALCFPPQLGGTKATNTNTTGQQHFTKKVQQYSSTSYHTRTGVSLPAISGCPGSYSNSIVYIAEEPINTCLLLSGVSSQRKRRLFVREYYNFANRTTCHFTTMALTRFLNSASYNHALL